MRTPFLAVLIVCLLAGGALAQDKGDVLDRKTLDEIVFRSLRDLVNNRGADLYNSGDANGCYRLYEGGLIILRPLLDHRPELQKAIDTGLADAEKHPMVSRKAFVLRGVIDNIRSEVNPRKGTTLWQRLGGEDNVTKVVDDLVAAAAADPKVDFFRGDKFKDKVDVAKLKKLLVAQISSVSNGPYQYDGRDMKTVHKGMGITDAQFDALAGHVRKALEKNGAKAEDVDAVLKVIGGTRKDIVEK